MGYDDALIDSVKDYVIKYISCYEYPKPTGGKNE